MKIIGGEGGKDGLDVCKNVDNFIVIRQYLWQLNAISNKKKKTTL